jgi:hypothetical protein
MAAGHAQVELEDNEDALKEYWSTGCERMNDASSRPGLLSQTIAQHKQASTTAHTSSEEQANEQTIPDSRLLPASV